MEKPDIVISPSLSLLALQEEHKDRFIELANMPEINSAINKPFPYTEAQFEDQFEKTQSDKPIFAWMIDYEGALVGVVNSADLRQVGLYQGGYWIDPSYWGKNIATQAQIAVRDYLVRDCKAERIQAVVEPSNHASMRVMEKCGYKKEGLLKKFYPALNRGLVDVWMYAYLP